MKPGVVIVNTARGAIIDESALVAAIEAGTVYSCGLDVYEDEPEVHPGLVGNEKVMLLPHMGTWTVEVSFVSSLPKASFHPSHRTSPTTQQTQTKMELWTISNVRAALESGMLKSPVPEQVDMP